MAGPSGQLHGRIAAQPVFRLLGAKDLGRSDDYHAEKMPGKRGITRGRLACGSMTAGTRMVRIGDISSLGDKFFGRIPAAVKAQ